MANMDDKARSDAQAVVTGGLADSALSARAGISELAVGGQSGMDSGADPYEILSASVAARTAMALRIYALRRKYPLSCFEVAVSYHHGADGRRDVFDRAITLLSELDEGQRAQLLKDANTCPIGKVLGLSTDIRTRDSAPDRYTSDSHATSMAAV